ncbi:MAG: hypothetical protein K0B52_04060 [FCB group bacterium]|nr:hypothetical protein [FCB group bacterium]
MERKHWIKLIIVWALYVGLHFVYKIFPCNLTLVFGCPEETIFHHMKMAFLSYTLVSIGEYFILKPDKIKAFINARMIAAILFSYFSFIIWYIYPAIFGPIEHAAGEIIYSNLILAVSLIATISLEGQFVKIAYDRTATAVIMIFYFIILAVFIISTFQTPHIDVFSPHVHH